MKIYHELKKFLDKEQDINVLIGSYLSGNNSKQGLEPYSSFFPAVFGQTVSRCST